MGRHVMILTVAVAAAVTLGAAACGGGGGGGSSPPSAGAPAPGGGLSIDEAAASTLEGPLLVKGYLVAPDGGEARLCSALLESYPPQCGGPSLVVEGLDLSSVEGLAATDDPQLARVTWSETEVSILGTVEDGTITVSATST